MLTIQPLNDVHRPQINAYILEEWSGPLMRSRGQVLDTRKLPGLVALEGGALQGSLLYHQEGDACEVVVLFSLLPGQGVGSRLLQAICDLARQQGCRRVWLVTTNDNIPAIRFYQRRGFDLAALYRDALTETRKIKPQIPLLGLEDIPLRHELEFEYLLQSP